MHVEEVRKMGNQSRSDLKERIERKLETAGEKREAQLNCLQDRIRQHVSIITIQSFSTTPSLADVFSVTRLLSVVRSPAIVPLVGSIIIAFE